MVSYKKMNISGICLRYLSAFAAAFLFTMLSVNVASASPVQGQISAEQSQISGVVVDENLSSAPTSLSKVLPSVLIQI